MAANEIHLLDIGTVFEITLYDGAVILSGLDGATAKSILFEKPDGTTVEKTAAFKTDGLDGIIQYITLANDLDQEGNWKIQARVVLADGSWSSDIGKFKVYPNLD